MRTNIDIDDDLLEAAMKVTGQTTKHATVEEALRRLVDAHKRHQSIMNSAGLGWDGDLDALRSGRSPK